MDKEEGPQAGPPDRTTLNQDFFDELVDLVKSKGIDEDDAEDIVQDSMFEGWLSFKEHKSTTGSPRKWIKDLLVYQRIPKYFRDKKHVFRGRRINKAERLSDVGQADSTSLACTISDSNLDGRNVYMLMKKSLPPRLAQFLDVELEACARVDGKQFIEEAATIAGIPLKQARNLHRQLVAKLRSNPDLLNHLRG